MENGDSSRQKLINDFFFHEADRISQRTDWFLIFHAILIESFVATHSCYLELTIGLFGVLVSYLWLMTGIRGWWVFWQIGYRMEETAGKEYKIIFDERSKHLPKWYAWAAPSPIFSIVVPFICLTTWIILLIFDLNNTLLIWAAFIFLTLSGLIYGLTRIIKKPEIPKKEDGTSPAE